MVKMKNCLRGVLPLLSRAKMMLRKDRTPLRCFSLCLSIFFNAFFLFI